MNHTAVFSEDNEILQETANRLIKALGADTAISVCRSNYWHGVLQLILDREAGPSWLRADADIGGPDLSVRLHSLPKAPAFTDRRLLDDIHEVALAA